MRPVTENSKTVEPAETVRLEIVRQLSKATSSVSASRGRSRCLARPAPAAKITKIRLLARQIGNDAMKQVLKVVTLYDKERLTIQEGRVLANELRIQEILRTAGGVPSGILTSQEITDTVETKEVLVPD
jgi:hypothetical protein